MTTRCFFVLLMIAFLSQLAIACPDVDGLVDVNCDGYLYILTFGDSITFGKKDELGLGYPGRLQIIFPHTIIVNLGLNGESTPMGRSRAASTFPAYSGADYIIILEGVNDYFLTTHRTSQTRNNLLLMTHSAEGVGAITLLAKLTDVRRSYQRSWVASVNNAIAPYTEVDFYSLGRGIISSDLLHPNGDGYQQMANLAASVLLNMSEQNRPIDRDSDGLYDYEEARYGTSPANADSDGDTLSDGDEVWRYHSNPLLVDGDGDGYSDEYEVKVLGSDPSNPAPGAPTVRTLQIVL